MSQNLKRAPAGEERILPWAEGDGMWQEITRLLSGLPAVDLATFLVHNPYTCDTAERLAERIGRYATQLQPVLDGLANAGFLRVTQMGSVGVYELTDDPRRRQTLLQYVTWLQEGYHWTRMAIDNRPPSR